MRTVYRILVRLSIVIGIVAVASLVISVIANRDAVFGTGRYAPFDLSTAELVPFGIREEKDGTLVSYQIPIDRTKSSWHEATRAGCAEAARGEMAPWCDYGDPVPDLFAFEYCTKSGAPVWCRGVEKLEPDRRVPTADAPGTPVTDSRILAQLNTPAVLSRCEALFSAFFVPVLIGAAAFAVLALAWILKPETTPATVP